MRKGTHSELFYHFVWATKDRAPSLDAEIELAVLKVIQSKAKELNFTLIEANGALDHIHVLVESTPVLLPADIAKHLKGSSSHFVNSEILKNDSTRALYWQDGYAVISVSPQAVASVQRYIRNQKEHHSEKKIKAEFEPLF